MIQNSKGKIYYGMHFYPGVAEYQEPGGEPYRIFLNEDTIRSMDPSFAGRPVFVEHVDEVDQSVDALRKEADGWVIESFYNQADGKHWAKFIVVSERAEKAIMHGMRLSNAYVPKGFDRGGLWNGVEYLKEVSSGEYEHLAIVRNPRYQESVILTPDEFKRYNEDKIVELKRLSNSKEEKSKMGLNFFKRAKVENSADFEGMSITLPKSKKEMTIVQLVEAMDKVENMAGYASPEHMVKVGNDEMSVNDLVSKHMSLNEELESMKKKKEDEMEGVSEVVEGKDSVDSESVEGMDNAEEDKAKEEKKTNELKAKKAEAKEKADKLRKAHLNAVDEEPIRVELMQDQIARGKSRYGA